MIRVAEDAPEGAPGASRLAVGDEPDLYEALRRGDEQAFTTLVGRYDPLLRRLAAVYVPDADAVAADAWHARVTHDAWTTALGGLDAFEWRCSLGAWVVGLFVAQARGAVGADRVRARGPGILPARGMLGWLAVGGGDEWQDLPWGARWAGVWATARAAVAALPVAHREVLWLHDVEEWRCLDVREVLGVTDERHRRVVAEARAGVARTLAELAARRVGGGAPGRATATPGHPAGSEPTGGCAVTLAHLTDGAAGCALSDHLRDERLRDGHVAGCHDCTAALRRLEATAGLLFQLRAADGSPAVDPALLRAFGRWRRRRRRRLRLKRRAPQPAAVSAGARSGRPPRAARASAATYPTSTTACTRNR